MTVYTYARVSTMKQASEGESLDAQQSRSAGYAQMMGLSVDRSFVDAGVSGSVPFTARPEGSALWSSLKTGDVVVACKLDRVFRSSLDALDTLSKLQAMGVELHLIDMGGNVCGNGIAKLVFTILSAVAEAERERTKERICDVKSYQKAQGRYLGGKVPFGFTVGEDGQLIEDDAQQKAIGKMRQYRAMGMSLRRISEEMLVNFDVKISFKGVSDVLERG